MSDAYFTFSCWRAAGRSLEVVQAFMERRRAYFDALNVYARSIGIDAPNYVTAPDEAVGFEIGPKDPTPAGYMRDTAQARSRVALRLGTRANPDRVYPTKNSPAAARLSELWRTFGGDLISASQLSTELAGQPGPFSAVASDGQSTTTMFYGLRHEADGSWTITGPDGAPAPYDAVPLPSLVRPVPKKSGAASAAALAGVSS